MRIIGLDIHRTFAEAVAWEDGRLRRLGRVDMRRDLLEAFAARLSATDVVVIEATGNSTSAAAVVAPYVNKVVIANPQGSFSTLRMSATRKASIVSVRSTISGRGFFRSPLGT